MPDHNLNFSVSGGGDTLGTLTVTSTGSLGIDFEAAVSTATEPEYPIAIDVSELESIFLYADGVVTIRTNANSGGAPAHTFVMAAAVPLVWTSDMPNANPFDTTDVTSIFIDNDSGATVNVYARINISE